MERSWKCEMWTTSSNRLHPPISSYQFSLHTPADATFYHLLVLQTASAEFESDQLLKLREKRCMLKLFMIAKKHSEREKDERETEEWKHKTHKS